MELHNFEEIIGYEFKDKRLLVQALTHTSYANEILRGKNSHLHSNQRLEFLGDSVLSIVVSTYLYEHFETMNEGDLSKLRAAIVSEEPLYKFALSIKLDEYILLGTGENKNGGRTKPSILSDAFESVIAAIYLDGGRDAAASFILNVVMDDIEKIAGEFATLDSKTNLQEKMRKQDIQPVYEIIGSDGPEHNKIFIASVECGDRKTFGKGHSKKDAEQKAAQAMLREILTER